MNFLYSLTLLLLYLKLTTRPDIYWVIVVLPGLMELAAEVWIKMRGKENE